MPVFNLACLGGKVDQETGCYRPNCDESGIFEACRQSFYIKQQNEILKQNPEATDEDILSYSGTKPPEEGFNLKKGFLKLREYELGLAGKTPEKSLLN